MQVLFFYIRIFCRFYKSILHFHDLPCLSVSNPSVDPARKALRRKGFQAFFPSAIRQLVLKP